MAKSTAKAAPASRRREEVIEHTPQPPPVNLPDLAPVQQEGGAIFSFLSPVALTEFFVTARSLEDEAGRMVASARAVKVRPITSDEEDLENQQALLASKDQRKRLLIHWTITAVVSRFHRLLTAGRERADRLHEEAETIRQTRHNDYSRAKQRRIEEQNRQREKEERDRQEAERMRQAAEAEAAAVAAEEASNDLSARELAFVEAVVSGQTPGVAAGRAGFKDTFKSAARLMASDKIAAAIKGKQDAAAIRQQAKAVQEMPIDTSHVVTESKPRATLGADVTYKSAEILDADAFIAAFQSGRYGIPASCFKVHGPGVNEQAEQMGNLINKWPGVRYVETTRTRR